MSEIDELRKRLEDINRQADKPYRDIKSLKEELKDLTHKIYRQVDEAGKDDRMHLDELIMLKNIIEFKIEKNSIL